jgi:hypothetical protein
LNWFAIARRPILLTVDCPGGDLELCQQIREAMRAAIVRGAPTLLLIKRLSGPACLLLGGAWYRYGSAESVVGPLDDRRIERRLLESLSLDKLPQWAYVRLQHSPLSACFANNLYLIDRVFVSQSAAAWSASELVF